MLAVMTVSGWLAPWRETGSQAESDTNRPGRRSVPQQRDESSRVPFCHPRQLHIVGQKRRDGIGWTAQFPVLHKWGDSRKVQQ